MPVFQPTSTISISATGTTSSGSVNAYSNSVRLYNAGPNTVFVRWTVGASNAAITDMPIPAGSIETFRKGNADTLSAICASGQTATLYVTSGEGA